MFALQVSRPKRSKPKHKKKRKKELVYKFINFILYDCGIACLDFCL